MSQAGALPVASNVQGHSSALRLEAQPLPCTASTAMLLGSDDRNTRHNFACAAQAVLKWGGALHCQDSDKLAAGAAALHSLQSACVLLARLDHG